MTCTVRQMKAAEIMKRPEFAPLCAEYAAESKGDGLPEPMPRFENYRQMELLNSLHVYGAFVEDTLIGFIVVIASKALHYNKLLPTVESWFVAKQHRHTLAGVKLLVAAEAKAKAIAGEIELRLCLPLNSDAIEWLTRQGYKKTNIILTKGIHDGLEENADQRVTSRPDGIAAHVARGNRPAQENTVGNDQRADGRSASTPFHPR